MRQQAWIRREATRPKKEVPRDIGTLLASFDMIQNPSRSAILRRLLDDQYRCRQHKKRTKLPILNLRHTSASISTMLMRPACSAYLRANTKTCMTATQTAHASSAASSRLRRGASFSDDSYRGNANIYHPVHSYAPPSRSSQRGFTGTPAEARKCQDTSGPACAQGIQL